MASRDTAPFAGRPAGGDAPLAALVAGLREELRFQAQRRAPEPVPDMAEETPAPVAPALLDGLTRRYGLPAGARELLRALGDRPIVLTPGPFQAIVLHAAPGLEAAQVGFRGPRRGDDAFIAPHGWRRAWVVIATDAGDPYFLDVTKATPDGECPVWTAMHGTGTWEPRLAASSLAQFLRILRVWARIVVPHHDPQNPDEPLDDAHLRRLATEIGQVDPAATDHWTI